MRVGVFGASRVEVTGDDGEPRWVEAGARKPRSIVAALVLEPGRPVGADRLADLVWAGDPPRAPHGALHAYISRLRRVLEPGVLETTDHGYVLRVDPADVDVHAFAADVRRVTTALAPLATQLGSGDAGGWPDRADVAAQVETLEAALGAWTGRPYADLGDHPDVDAERAALDQLRLSAEQTRVLGLLALGEHAGLLSVTESSVAAHPLQERWWGLHALALTRAGRQADALAALRQVRELLADELGLDPGPGAPGAGAGDPAAGRRPPADHPGRRSRADGPRGRAVDGTVRRRRAEAGAGRPRGARRAGGDGAGGHGPARRGARDRQVLAAGARGVVRRRTRVRRRPRALLAGRRRATALAVAAGAARPRRRHVALRPGAAGGPGRERRAAGVRDLRPDLRCVAVRNRGQARPRRARRPPLGRRGDVAHAAPRARRPARRRSAPRGRHPARPPGAHRCSRPRGGGVRPSPRAAAGPRRPRPRGRRRAGPIGEPAERHDRRGGRVAPACGRQPLLRRRAGQARGHRRRRPGQRPRGRRPPLRRVAGPRRRHAALRGRARALVPGRGARSGRGARCRRGARRPRGRALGRAGGGGRERRVRVRRTR